MRTMLTFEETLHKHDPFPAHLRIHLVDPLSKADTQLRLRRSAEKTAAAIKLRSRVVKISSVVAAAPALGAILYWAQNF